MAIDYRSCVAVADTRIALEPYPGRAAAFAVGNVSGKKRVESGK